MNNFKGYGFYKSSLILGTSLLVFFIWVLSTLEVNKRDEGIGAEIKLEVKGDLGFDEGAFSHEKYQEMAPPEESRDDFSWRDLSLVKTASTQLLNEGSLSQALQLLESRDETAVYSADVKKSIFNRGKTLLKQSVDKEFRLFLAIWSSLTQKQQEDIVLPEDRGPLQAFFIAENTEGRTITDIQENLPEPLSLLMTYRALLKYRSLCESDADIDVFNALLPLYCLGQQKLMDLIRNKSGNGLPRYEDAKYFFINYLRESYVEPILGQFHKNYKAISERESGDLQRWYKGQIIEEGSFTLQNFRPLLRAQALMFLKDRYRAFCNKEFSKYYMTYMGILKQQKESLSFLLVIQEIQANDDYRKHIHCFDYPKALAFTQGVLSTEMMKEILTLEMRRQAWRYFDTNLKAEKQFLMSSYSPLKSVAKLFRLGDLGSGSSTALLANSLWEKVSPVDIYAALKVLSKSKNQLERNMTVNVLAAFLNNRVWLKKYSGWTAEDARQFLRKR